MKRVFFLSGFLFFSFSVFGQNWDSLAVVREVDSLIQVSRILTAQGDFEKALEVNAVAEKLALEKLGQESVAYGSCCHDRGRANFFKGDYPEAETYYQKAISIRRKALGKEHLDYAQSLNNLANLYFLLGNLEDAGSLHFEAKVIRENMLGKEHLVYAQSLNNLAVIYSRMGNYEGAERLFLDAININGKILGKNTPEYADNLDNLAVLYCRMDSFVKAESLFLNAKDIREKASGKEHPDYATSLNNLGGMYFEMKNYENAELFYLESKSIREKILGNEHPLYANSLGNLAELYDHMGNYEKAELCYQQAITIQKKNARKEGNSEQHIWLLDNLAKFYEKQKRYLASGLALEELSAMEQVALKKAISFLSERELAQHTATFQKHGDNLGAYLLARLQINDQTGILPAIAFNHALFHNGFLLTAACRLNLLPAFNPEASEINLRLKGYLRRLSIEYTRSIAERKNVAELEEKVNVAERELARIVTGYADAIRQVKWPEVQSVLKPGEVAIEVVHFRVNFPKNTDSTMYAALLLRPGDESPRCIPLFEEKQLDSLLPSHTAQRQNYLNKIYSSTTRGAKPLNRKEFAGLYELIWKPLEKDMKGIKTVYYSPSGLLHRLNLGAIPLPAWEKSRKNQTLADRYRMVQFGSTRQLVIPTSLTPAANDIALFGGIRYEKTDTTGLQPVNAEVFASRTRGNLSFTYSDSTLRTGTVWEYLPGTEREVREVGNIARSTGIAVRAFSGSGATEEALKSLGMAGPQTTGSPRILHLATHGFFFPDPAVNRQPSTVDREPVFKLSDHPMIRSGLLLAGANHAWATGKPLKPGMEDGILTAYEISQMNLSNTELVVLSACETGLGDIQGNEGVYGLQRAFKIAGVKYLIMSLWQVPDKQTSLLMTTFYRKWLEEKMPIPEAFRAAQKELREAGLDPYQWAGFVLVE